MPSVDRRPSLFQASPYGPEVPASAGATAWDRLAAFMGREPQPASV